MAITLFPHNQTAYNSLLAMLDETGKACVVHPTGTGKSFIAFKYCEDHPEQRILWLSPSEYIFKTQRENLVATGAEVPQNIQFCTYAKLSIMDGDEIAELRPDAIIEDEFHRCGAHMWQQGAERLWRQYPNALRIGLSATSVRYLDSQRDMKAEIYDNCVASEMTLGDAIVRGILNAPTYVLSVFSYEQDYKKLKSRVRRAKSKAVRESAERYLEALRRALENADGLDVIFDKHMKDRHGKYLVFTSNLEHMDEMLRKVPEWFGKIDPEPHVYSVSADDPGSRKTFQAFKADTSDHLKLLFSVDLLNEGVHVEDVSGVILFRPTVGRCPLPNRKSPSYLILSTTLKTSTALARSSRRWTWPSTTTVSSGTAARSPQNASGSLMNFGMPKSCSSSSTTRSPPPGTSCTNTQNAISPKTAIWKCRADTGRRKDTAWAVGSSSSGEFTPERSTVCWAKTVSESWNASECDGKAIWTLPGTVTTQRHKNTTPSMGICVSRSETRRLTI